MTHYLFKPKKRDVVQYIIVLAVISIILAFAFPKIKYKMGNANNSSMSKIDVALSNVDPNANGLQNGSPSVPPIVVTDNFDTNYPNIPYFGFPYTGNSADGVFIAYNGVFYGRGENIPIYQDDDCYGCWEPIIGYDPGTTMSQITLDIPSGKSGQIDFDYKVSSDSNNYLNITLDGNQIVHISGQQNWQHYQQNSMSPGLHTLQFEYKKTNTNNVGSDAAYIDTLTLTLTQA